MTLRTAALAATTIALVIAACGGGGSDNTQVEDLEATIDALTGVQHNWPSFP